MYIVICGIVVAKREKKMRLGRPRLRLEDNIKMDPLLHFIPCRVLKELPASKRGGKFRE
jgi:hypothetical protein